MNKTKLNTSEFTALFFLNNDLEELRQKASKIASNLEKYKTASEDIKYLIEVLYDLSSFDLEDAYINL